MSGVLYYSLYHLTFLAFRLSLNFIRQGDVVSKEWDAAHQEALIVYLFHPKLLPMLLPTRSSASILTWIMKAAWSLQTGARCTTYSSTIRTTSSCRHPTLCTQVPSR